MKLLKHTASVVVLSLLVGCVMSHGPGDSAGFSKTVDLKQLEGCYANKGDGGDRNGTRYLSLIIFPEYKLDPRQVHYIRVASVGEKALKVSAEAKGQKFHEKTFVEGQDFRFDEGRIKLNSEGGAIAPNKPGSVFLGVAHGTKYLGIDEKGSGRLEESGALAGTAFLVIPVAGYIKEAFSFKKTPELCN